MFKLKFRVLGWRPKSFEKLNRAEGWHGLGSCKGGISSMLKPPSGKPLALEFPWAQGPQRISVTVSPHRSPEHAACAVGSCRTVGMPCLFGSLCVYVLSVLGGGGGGGQVSNLSLLGFGWGETCDERYVGCLQGCSALGLKGALRAGL